jgi:hypothetical protein
MSSNTNNFSNNSKVSAPIAAPLDNKNNFLENLDLHISRISAKTTPDHIARTLYELSIAEVDYVDIVATKDPETKAVLYYSAFIRLIKWGPERFPAGEFAEKKMFKIFLNRYSSDSAEKYWVLYPNKNPLPRTRVNVHQLAASTEKLFDNAEQLTETVSLQKAEIESLKTANDECSSKLATAEAHIAALMENVAYMMAKFEPREARAKHDAESKERFQKFNTQCKEDGDKRRAATAAAATTVPVPVPNTAFKKVDDDDCMFSKPVRKDWSYIAENPLKMTAMEKELISHLNNVAPTANPYFIMSNSDCDQWIVDLCGNK